MSLSRRVPCFWKFVHGEIKIPVLGNGKVQDTNKRMPVTGRGPSPDAVGKFKTIAPNIEASYKIFNLKLRAIFL